MRGFDSPSWYNAQWCADTQHNKTMEYEEIKEILTKNAMNYKEFLFTMLLKDTTQLGGAFYDNLWIFGKKLYDVYTRSKQSKQVNKSDYQCMMEWIKENKQLINILTND